MFVERDALGNPVDRNHPWNQTTIPQPQKRDFDDKYSWVMSPRWFDGKDHLACDTGGGPIARLWATALGGLVDIGYVKSTGHSVLINLPKTMNKPEVTFEWKIPQWSNALERNRARTYFQAYAAACALYFCEQALAEVRAGRTKTWESFEVPDEAFSCGFTEAVRGVLSHHMVIKDGKIANYHPYPPTPWNASVRDVYGTPGPYEDAVQNTPIFEENSPDNFKGIDIMRAVRSFDPCLPCGVHMYLGPGKTLQTMHNPATMPTDAGDLRRGRAGTVDVGEQVEALLAQLRRQGGDPAADTGEELVRAARRVSTATASSGSSRSSGRRGPDLVRPAGRRPARREPADPARAAPAQRGRADRGGAGPGPALSRLARRRCRLPRRRRRRRRAPAPGRQLQRLPVLDRHRDADHRGGRAGGGARRSPASRSRAQVESRAAAADRAAARARSTDAARRRVPCGCTRRPLTCRASGQVPPGPARTDGRCSWPPDRRHLLRLRRQLPGLRRASLDGRRACDGDVLTCASLRGRGTTCGWPAGPPTGPGAASTRCRCSTTSRASGSPCDRRRCDRACRSGLRRFVGRPADADAADFVPRREAPPPRRVLRDVRRVVAGRALARRQLESRSLLCTCRPCYLLFTREGAGRGNYRAVPDRYLTDPDFELSDAQWDELQVPVAMAFFFYNSLLGRIVAQYPSPAGATESLLDLVGVGRRSRAQNPLAAALAPDVEALIVRRVARGQRVLPRADRRLLRAGRPGPDALDRLRRRAGGAAGHRRTFFARVRARSRPLRSTTGAGGWLSSSSTASTSAPTGTRPGRR